MAMSQYSFGSLHQAKMKDEKLLVDGGYNTEGQLTKDPSEIILSKRPLPIGYWKGAGLSLLLDILATILSGGLSTQQISEHQIETSVSQVFIAIDISKLNNHSSIARMIENIISDYHQSATEDEKARIMYPGERVLATRKNNLANGIPVIKSIWEEILQL
jgi:3-dehydro-L-gulonate 2-dehydrogenase